MTDELKPQQHYAETVLGLPPTKIICACGTFFVGSNCMLLMEAHVDVQDAIEELEGQLERRNVFDLAKDKDDEETP